MEKTKSALKAISKLSENNNVQISQNMKETPEVNSPAWVVESAAGTVIPKPVSLYGLTQLSS